MPKEYDAVPLTALETLPLALHNFIAHCGADGVLGKVDIQGLVDYIAPFIAAIGSSSYVSTTGTVLSNPTDLTSAFTFVSAGTYTQTTGGDVVVTDPFNLLSWNGTTWSYTTGIASGLFLTEEDISTEFVLDSDQLFDVATMVTQGYVDSSGGIVTSEVGSEVATVPLPEGSTSIAVSGLNNVTGGTKRGRFYNVSNAIVGSVISFDFTTPYILSVPVGAVGISITTKRATNDSDKSTLMVNEGTSALPYDPFDGEEYVNGIAGNKVLSPNELASYGFAKASDVPSIQYGTVFNQSGNQLFDKATMEIVGQFIAIDGNSYPETDAVLLSVEIPDDITEITMSGTLEPVGTYHAYRWLNDAEAMISFAEFTTDPVTISKPEEAVKFQATIKRGADVGDYDSILMLNSGSTALPFEAYVAPEESYELLSVTLPELDSPILAVTARTGERLVPGGTQMFDKDTMVISNRGIDSNGALFNETGAVTIMIPVPEDASELTINGVLEASTGNKNIAWYNSLNQVVGRPHRMFSTINTAIKPDGAVVMYVCIKRAVNASSNVDNIMINEGYTPLSYAAYVDPTPQPILKKVNEADVEDFYPGIIGSVYQKLSPYYGMKLVTLGHSIVEMCEWQPLVAHQTGMVWSIVETQVGTGGNPRMGIGGSRIIPLIQAGVAGKNPGESIYYRADYVDTYSPDVIIVQGLQNDGFASSYDLNDAPYTGPEVTSGAPTMVASLKGVFEKLISQNPRAKIFFMSDMFTNTVALNATQLQQYEDKFNMSKAVCGMYSVEFIDLLHNVGINYLNVSTTNRPGDPVHPANLGGLKMARKILTHL